MPDVRVVILIGAGDKAFVSAPITASSKKPADARPREYSRRSEAQRALMTSTKPTIACAAALPRRRHAGREVTDIRIASDNSQFGIPAAKLGIAYGYDGLKVLVSLVGPSWSRLISTRAMRIEATEALRIGLVERVLPDAQLMGRDMEIGARFPATPMAIKAAKITIAEV